MCGIIGILGSADVAPQLLDGLKRLEYRGYDSAGIATLKNGHIERRRAEGKLINLATRLQSEPLDGSIGIGHTRWATHGSPTETNAHPHATDRVAVVHNGIIENFQSLRSELEAKGRKFVTETDTETIAHLITDFLDTGLSPKDAAAAAISRLEGAFALAIIFAGEDDLMIGARRGSPLAIGYGDEGSKQYFLGSDALALAPLTNRISYLEEGDWAELSSNGVIVHDESGQIVTREIHQTAVTGAMIGKGQYRHYMLKEIFEQPAVIGDTIKNYINTLTSTMSMPHFPFDAKGLTRITIATCGTAYYAGMVGKYWLEKFAKVPVELDIASEFRYREGPLPEGGAALFVSQSGETADTLAALKYAASQDQKIVSIVNVAESSIARLSDLVLPTMAGPEIGVASTKAFTTQLVVLASLAIALGKARGVLDAAQEKRLIDALIEVPALVKEVLQKEDDIITLAQKLVDASDVLYLGRGTAYPIALEAALKLKEISYIHAEGYAAGELKHGPIALIDESMPVIVIAPEDGLLDKTISNIEEVAARGGKVAVFSSAKGIERVQGKAMWTMDLPEVDEFTAPILYSIPVQLLAYHTAVLKGTDVDQPRNLAKSVTVE